MEKANSIGNLEILMIFTLLGLRRLKMLNIDSTMRRLQFEEEIEMQRAENFNSGVLIVILRLSAKS